MPVNKIDITFTAAQVTAINGAIATIISNIPFAQNLTLAERDSVPNIQDNRYPYAQKAVEILAPANPILVSGFAGTLAQAVTDWTLVKQFDTFIPDLLKLVEMFNDTRQVAASEVYAFLLEFYASAQRAAANNVPGADSIVEALAPLFAGQGPQPK